MIWWIYLISIVDCIRCFFIVIGVLLMIAMTIVFMATCEEDNVRFPFKKGFILGVIMLFLGCLIPESTAIAAMIIIPRIAENKTLQDIGTKATTVLEGKLDEWMKGVTKAKKE